MDDMETCLSDVNKYKQLCSEQIEWETKDSLIKMISFLSLLKTETCMHIWHTIYAQAHLYANTNQWLL